MRVQRLSIVICSYQQAPYLRETLESVTRQRDVSKDELEILVMDGGSTDGSVDIIREFEPHLNYWTSEPDRGQTHALRKGFERATGDVLGWLCSDDLIEPGTARQVLDVFNTNAACRFCYGNTNWIDPAGKVLVRRKEIPFNWFIWRYSHDYIPQPSSFWQASLYHEVGGLDESFNLAMDADLFARFAEKTHPVHVDSFWSRMRTYPQQKTQRMRAQSREEFRVISGRHGAHVHNPAARWAGYAAAKALRCSWKLAKGCYWQ